MPIRILVVDDEVDVEALMRQKFRRQIRDGAYEFFFAHDGEEALEKLREHPDVDVLITDINMPRMDGLTLLQKIKEQNIQLNAVVVSAYGDMANIRTAMNRGAFDFLMKPIDFADFEITLAKTWDQISKSKRATRDQAELSAIVHELKVASIIQKAILPSEYDAFPGRHDFDIRARNYPVKEVSGDFYDYFLIGQSRLGFLICDVSGKGVPSALYMAVCRTLIRTCAEPGTPASSTLEAVNRKLCEEDYASMFATMLYGILDTATGEVEFCCAGHELPYLLNASSGVRSIPMPRNLALGIEPDVTFHSVTITVHPGETLFLYTDGATEAQNAAEEFYLSSRLEEELAKRVGLGAEALLDGINEAIGAFVGNAPQSDDLTMLALHFRGAPASKQTPPMTVAHFSGVTPLPVTIPPAAAPTTKPTLFRRLGSDLAELEGLFVDVTEFLQQHHVPDGTVNAVQLVTEEWLVNVMSHGLEGVETPWVEYELSLGSGRIMLIVRDSGPPFDPTLHEPCDIPLDSDDRLPGGLGIELMLKMMDEVRYQRAEHVNALVMARKLS